MAWCAVLLALAGAGSGLQDWDPSVKYQSQPIPAESRQFDFAIGEWDVVSRRFDLRSEELVSELHATVSEHYRNDGRLIVSEWTGRDPVSGAIAKYGITLRTFSPEANAWHNVFVSSHQAAIPSGFELRWKNGEMVGTSLIEDAAGNDLHFRIVMFDIEANSYEFRIEYSRDGLKWRTERTQSFRRRN